MYVFYIIYRYSLALKVFKKKEDYHYDNDECIIWIQIIKPTFSQLGKCPSSSQFTNHTFKCCMQVAASYYHKMGEKHNSVKHTLVWAKPYIPLDKHTKTSEMCVVATRALSFDICLGRRWLWKISSWQFNFNYSSLWEKDSFETHFIFSMVVRMFLFNNSKIERP